MPVLQFKGKSVIETYHHSVPHHRLEFDAKLSVLPKGAKPGLDGNLILEGDNLLALKALLPTHAGKVKCVYIDPPYNTGNEGWVYNDNLTQPQFKEWIGQTVGKEGEDACRHDKWCCMMYPRLMLLKELLRDDGVIFISIDDNEVQHLRMLMDEVYGPGNFIANLVWEKGRKNDAKLFSVGHEYMMVFAKSKETLNRQGVVWREPRPGGIEIWNEYRRLKQIHGDAYDAIEAGLQQWFRDLPDKHPSKKLTRFKHVDRFGPWRDRDISWPGGGGPRYDVIHPVTHKPCVVPERGWGFATPEAMQRQVDLGLVKFRNDHSDPPFRKAHLKPPPEELEEDTDASFDLEEDSEEGIGMQVMGSYIYKQSQVAVRYLRELMGEKVFENPKDYEVICRMIKYCTEPGDLVLDSFAGSGTTGEAVIRSSAAGDKPRQFILIQQCYDTKDHEKKRFNICQKVTAERIKRVISTEKQQGGHRGSFTFVKLGDPLFGEYRDLGKKLPDFEQLARYVFYTETSRDCDPGKFDPATGFIGSTEPAGGTSYCLLYTPNHKQDREMSLETLKALAKQDKNRNWVIYCEKIWLHQDQLRAFEIEHGRRIRPMLVPFNLK